MADARLSASASFCAFPSCSQLFFAACAQGRKAEKQKAESNRHRGTKNKTLHPTHEQKESQASNLPCAPQSYFT